MRKNLAWIIGFFSLLLVPSVLAIDFSPDIAGVLEDSFQMFYDALDRYYVQFGITTIFLIILFYNLFCAGLSKVSTFGGSGGANKYGRMVALALSMMATLGLLFLGPEGPYSMLERILGSMGFIAAVATAVLVFGISYYNLRNGDKTWPLTLISTGLGMMTYGMITDNPGWTSLGFLLLLVGLIWFVVAGNAPGREPQRNTRTTTPDRTTGRTRQGDNDSPERTGRDRGTGEGGTGTPDRVTGVWGELIPEPGDDNSRGGTS